MAGFANLKQLVDAETSGFGRLSSWRKAPTQTTGAGVWFDLSMSPGNPVPNYYIGTPGIFVPLAQSTDGGLYHGGNVAPKKKILRQVTGLTPTAAATPLPMVLCDYIGHYPFLDESVTDEQFLDNTLSPTRWLDDKSVQIMAVVVAGQTGGQNFTVKYTNQDGVSGRVTPPHQMTTQGVNGTILSSAGAVVNSRGPFMALQDGDTGVRFIESVTFGGTGDIGLVALVLVKPLASFSLRGIDAPTEVDYIEDAPQTPIIPDDAYLNFICLPSGTLSGAQIHGLLEVCWA